MTSCVRNRTAKEVVWSTLGKDVLGALLTVFIGALWCQQAEAKPPVAGTYSRTFDTPTNLYGMNMTGWVAFYSTSNNVEFARLAADAVMLGKTLLPAGTGIHFTPDGKPDWFFLAKNWEIEGHLFNGGGHDWMTCFYPSGQLESGGLVHVEVIDGFPCQAAAPGFWGLHHPRTCFYEDGKLKSAEAAVTFRYRGVIVKKGSTVELKPDGGITSVK